MGVKSFFKKLPGRIWKGVKIGVPIAAQFGIPIPAIGIIRAGIIGVEAIRGPGGGKDKAVLLLQTILPALQKQGINLGPQKVMLITELLLAPETNNLTGEDSEWTLDLEEAVKQYKRGQTAYPGK